MLTPVVRTSFVVLPVSPSDSERPRVDAQVYKELSSAGFYTDEIRSYAPGAWANSKGGRELVDTCHAGLLLDKGYYFHREADLWSFWIISEKPPEAFCDLAGRLDDISIWENKLGFNWVLIGSLSSLKRFLGVVRQLSLY